MPRFLVGGNQVVKGGADLEMQANQAAVGSCLSDGQAK